METSLRKLTEEEKQKIIYVYNDFFNECLPDETPESEYITEYDVLMKKKQEEYIQVLLETDEPDQIEALLETCDDYIIEKDESGLSVFVMMMGYDMWLHKSPVWPVKHNPEQEKWDKLKEKKIKRKDVK